MSNPISIFIVEDEAIAAESLKLDLEQLGYQVVGLADNKKQAVSGIYKTKPDLILMDIKIKDEDGITLAKELNRRSSNSIPIVYLTAYTDKETIKRAIKSSPYGFIAKPYKIELLETGISIALNKHQEITEKQIKLQKQQEKLDAISKYDNLTQLPNQLSLVENFNAILEVFYQQINAQAESYEETIPSLIPILYLDFSRFNLIRDEMGIDVANSLFKAIVKRLKANLGDDAIIARLEHYEFCVISLPIRHRQAAIDLAEDLLEKITPPLIYKNRKVYIDFNIGISFYPIQGDHINDLLNNAKAVVSDNRKLGLNQYEVYSPAFHTHHKDEVSIEAGLHDALNNEEFELFYQPKVNIVSNKIIGVEALLRWNDPDNKNISPGIFIPIAEEIGLIDRIGDWVLNKACEHFKMLEQKCNKQLEISINFSSRQFNNNLLEQKIFKILAEHYFNPEFIEIELTESLLIKNPSLAIKKLNKLKSAGLKIAIDDFGKGYSSLGYLQHFSFDTLKIDRDFIKNIDANYKNASIVRCLIQMAHQLNLKVVAEGVETPGELNFLASNDCDAFQGYLFSRPIAFDQLIDLVSLRND
ncbi:response regulator receiver modulated diguanylate cyclase/phosphodiesterase [Cyanobacterium stanieri PCC 7202]|uniref:Response regulator receiver modulated diguanylate cyclase/phosphodiesterase n=1 Tax=Cyanobacterium stanieri (strain ATCC 29140 / PCC 7202) TaxID=292563 RepID=K9YM38_CYASC|nr:response regulator receiver modulated diguanylate cyclase/phosphodiesterase [Cyanobacterium stanieri PCC 7202]